MKLKDKYESQMKKGVLDMLVLKLLEENEKYGYQIIQELKEKGQNLEEYGATFGEIKADFNNQEFNGANVTAVFGSVDLDLRNAVINEDKLIKTCAVFGGIEMIAPENVNIKVKSIPIFGATSNKTGRKYDEKLPTIYVDSFCMFGGVDIK